MFQPHSKITRKLIHRFLMVYTAIFLILALLILTASGVLMLRSARQTTYSSTALSRDALYSF